MTLWIGALMVIAAQGVLLMVLALPPLVVLLVLWAAISAIGCLMCGLTLTWRGGRPMPLFGDFCQETDDSLLSVGRR